MEYNELIFSTQIKHAHNFHDWTGWENEYFKVIGEAPSINNRARWNCLCKSCGKYCIKDATNLLKHKSCGCARGKRVGEKLRKDLTNQRFGMLIAKKYAGYSNSSGNAVWECQCDCGNITYVDSNNLVAKHTLSCGCINSSIGVENICKILKDNNITFKQEYGLSEVFDTQGYPFRLDFVIYKNNQIIRAIEYDGIQHFIETWGAWKQNSRITLKIQQERDHRKNQWCLLHNIPLVRIPYWERDNITLEMLMGDQYLVRKTYDG